jgi:outer membrane receptor protein involved in Fe transport
LEAIPCSTNAVIAEGTMLTNAARLSGRLWSTYKFRQELLSNLTVGGGMTYVGERNGDLFQPYDVPGYARFDAFISYRPSPRIRFSLNIENLTDKDYINV